MDTNIIILYSVLFSFFIINGVKRQEKDKTNNKFEILLPTTFEKPMLELTPFIELDIASATDTANSGILVPIATIVIPIIIDGMLNFLAIVIEESKNILQHLIKKNAPITNNIKKAIICKGEDNLSKRFSIIFYTLPYIFLDST